MSSQQSQHSSLRLTWENARSGLWFVPAVLVAAGAVLAVLCLYLDSRLGSSYAQYSFWLFTGSGQAARTLLSVVAGSLINVVAVTFSVTMIAIQQAATQYTPRLLRNFTSDPGNQIVLGTYLGTFTYALIVLRQVRGSEAETQAFIPTISIFVAIALALVSLGLLVYFIHHASEWLQVEQVLERTRAELASEIDSLFPEQFGAASQDPPPFGKGLTDRGAAGGDEAGRHQQEVRSSGQGYLRYIDRRELLAGLSGGRRWAAVPVKIGDYLRPGIPLLRLLEGEELEREQLDRLHSAFQLDRSRSIRQDVLFGLRQMVDIALRALSPGVQDPTTAEQTIDFLSASIGALLSRELPSPERELDGARVTFCLPSFADYVDAAFTQIRRAARNDAHVSEHLLSALRSLVQSAPSAERAEPLQEQISFILSERDGKWR